MKKLIWLLSAVLALALSLPAAAQGKGKNKGRSDSGSGSTQVSASISFGKTEQQLIRDWFSNPQNLKGLPPGLAKREELPAGLKRHLVKNGTLPPGLQKKIQPVPPALKSQLPRPPEGIDIVFVAGNVLAIEVSTHKILDIVADIQIAL